MNIKESTPMNPFLSRYIEYRIKLFRKKGLYFQLFALEKSFKICYVLVKRMPSYVIGF